MIGRAGAVSLLAALGFVAACAWPLVNFVNINLSQLAIGAYGSPDDLVTLTIAAIASGALLSWLMGRVRGGWDVRLLTVLSAAVFLTFGSAALRDWIKSGGVSSGSTLAAGLVIIGVLIGCWVLSRTEPFRVMVGIASVIALLIPLSGVIPSAAVLVFASKLADATIAEEALATSLSGENVYYIVPDGYSGARTLQSFGYDNSTFLSEMAERGFGNDPDALSNYLVTHLSLMAILDADYPATEGSPKYVDRSGFFPVSLNNGHVPRAMQQFEAAGYSTLRLSNWWGGCNDKVFSECYDNTSASSSYAFDTFLQPTILSSILSREVIFGAVQTAEPDGALDLFEHHFPEIWSARPYFLFLHHLAPHEPYTRNADCSVRNGSDGDSSLETAQKVVLFLNATSCVNKQLLSVVDLIIEHDPSAIVVVQSDHGSDFHVDWDAPLARWSEGALSERAEILSLVRLPQECRTWDTRGRGQVNTMRLVLGCLQRSEPDFLPEATYASAYETHPEFGTVVAITY
jgi:hypothetical protein